MVTGAGKTLLALFIAELLQNTEDKDLRLVIIVPTIVLMHQWYDAILEHGNVPAEAIGRLGGGYDEGFEWRQTHFDQRAGFRERTPSEASEGGECRGTSHARRGRVPPRRRE